ncbi:MAG: VTC domain-containing protein [Oscillospiraceae bacterium]
MTGQTLIVTQVEQSEEFINSGTFTEKHYQIESEIAYFINFYKDIAPAMFVSYERIAFVGVDNQNLRITFDKNITYREHELSLDKGVWGTKLLNEGERVLEIKIPGAMPLWLAEILDDLKIYPTSFSKYGRAYLQTVNKKLKMEKVNNCA